MGIQDSGIIAQVDFEVFGQVQGCYFTKYCRDMCTEHGIKGWVKNSKRGTIVGKMQGPKADIDIMVDWLSNVGSPECKIENCELSNWGNLARMDYKDFSIRF